jgi:hypothetical protein
MSYQRAIELIGVVARQVVGGRYFEDCNEARVVHSRGEGGVGGVAPYALDPANAERLWEVSLELIA